MYKKIVEDILNKNIYSPIKVLYSITRMEYVFYHFTIRVSCFVCLCECRGDPGDGTSEVRLGIPWIIPLAGFKFFTMCFFYILEG